MFELVNLVFVPPAKDDALSLNLYSQHPSGTLDLISDSNNFPAFCANITPPTNNKEWSQITLKPLCYIFLFFIINNQFSFNWNNRKMVYTIFKLSITMMIPAYALICSMQTHKLVVFIFRNTSD